MLGDGHAFLFMWLEQECITFITHHYKTAGCPEVLAANWVELASNASHIFSGISDQLSSLQAHSVSIVACDVWPLPLRYSNFQLEMKE